MTRLLYVKTHVWIGACIAKLTSSGQVLVLPSRRLVRPAAYDDFVKEYPNVTFNLISCQEIYE